MTLSVGKAARRHTLVGGGSTRHLARLAPTVRRGLAVVAASVTLILSVGCSASSNDSSQAPDCDDLLSRTIGLIRAGQTGNGHDALTAAIEGLRTGGCSEQSDVFADYSSSRVMAKQIGPGPCSELARYDIKPAAIQLLREDGFCTRRRVKPPADTLAKKIDPSGAIGWQEAGHYVGTNQRVCGPLAGIGTSDDDAFLNVGKDYPDPERFTIVLWDVGGVERTPLGTLVCASGRITTYQGVAQIELRSFSAVEIRK